LQKSIICLLTDIIRQNTYERFSIIFDKNKELFDIILFVFKNSISDVKIDALNLILLIDNENNLNYFENKDIKIFIQKEILPTFLIDVTNNLSLNKENNEEENNEIILEKKNSNILHRKNCLIEDDLISEEETKKYGLKKRIIINGLKYIRFSSNENLKEFNKKYNKKKI
jgi:hypothetical protein